MKTLRDEKTAIERGIVNTKAHLVRLEERLKAVEAAICNVEPFYEKPTESAFLNGPLGLFSPGITDAVRGVYQSLPPGDYISPVDVRESLKERGLLKGYDNEMAVIHQVIRRLQDQGQIEPHSGEKKIHRWIHRTLPPVGSGRLRSLRDSGKEKR